MKIGVHINRSIRQIKLFKMPYKLLHFPLILTCLWGILQILDMIYNEMFCQKYHTDSDNLHWICFLHSQLFKEKLNLKKKFTWRLCNDFNYWNEILYESNSICSNCSHFFLSILKAKLQSQIIWIIFDNLAHKLQRLV